MFVKFQSRDIFGDNQMVKNSKNQQQQQNFNQNQKKNWRILREF